MELGDNGRQQIRNRRGLRFEDGGKTLHERVQSLVVLGLSRELMES